MPLTPQDVADVKFPFGRKGYNEDDVDAFLDRVEAELTRLLAENSELRERLAGSARALDEARASGGARTAQPDEAATVSVPVASAATPGETEQAALRTLAMAQRTSDEVVAEARREAEQIVAAAERTAAERTSDAHQQRIALDAHIEELRAFERDYRTRLRAYLQSQLADLDGGAAAPAPVAAVPDGSEDAAPADEHASPFTTAPSSYSDDDRGHAG